MLGFQAKVTDRLGNEIVEKTTEVYDGGSFFMMTVSDMTDRLGKDETLEIKRVPKK
jgi:hypothetical protein